MGFREENTTLLGAAIDAPLPRPRWWRTSTRSCSLAVRWRSVDLDRADDVAGPLGDALRGYRAACVQLAAAVSNGDRIEAALQALQLVWPVSPAVARRERSLHVALVTARAKLDDAHERLTTFRLLVDDVLRGSQRRARRRAGTSSARSRVA